jgi:hypothetical protein
MSLTKGTPEYGKCVFKLMDICDVGGELAGTERSGSLIESLLR